MTRAIRILLLLLPTLLAGAYVVFRIYEREYFYSPPAHPTSSDDFLTLSQRMDFLAMTFWSLPVFFLAVLVWWKNRSAVSLCLMAALAIPWVWLALASTDHPSDDAWHLSFLAPIVLSLTGIVLFFLPKPRPDQRPKSEITRN